MCDRQTIEKWASEMQAAKLSRRALGMAGGGAVLAGSLAGCTTMGMGGLTERMVTFAAPGGTADAFLVHPARGEHPAVIFWPDIAGLREAKRQMARRLARQGYAVLVMNPYYRDRAGEIWEDFAAFADSGGFQTVGPWREKLNSQAVQGDARAAAAYLDGLDAVDSDAGMGTQGYCMGGPFALWSAAALPNRIKAAASFHGGGLVRESAASPHRLMDQMDAELLIAIARDDAADNPDHERILNESATAAGIAAEIDVYAGDHGWTVPDSPAYSQVPAERAWANLTELYETRL